MAESGKTRAAVNKEIRRKALREQLQAQGHIQHITELLDILMDLDKPLDQIEVQRLDKTINHKLSIVKKYLPDVKTVEHTGEDGEKLFPESITVKYD